MIMRSPLSLFIDKIKKNIISSSSHRLSRSYISRNWVGHPRIHLGLYVILAKIYFEVVFLECFDSAIRILTQTDLRNQYEREVIKRWLHEIEYSLWSELSLQSVVGPKSS